MKNLQKEIERAKQEAIRVFQEKYQNDADAYVPCVFIQRLSPQKIHVGWRFTASKTRIGEIQEDYSHPAFDIRQKIVWVWQDTRKTLKNLLCQCTKQQQERFKLMYAFRNHEDQRFWKKAIAPDMTMTIEEVVDNLPEKKLEWALYQIQNILCKH